MKLSSYTKCIFHIISLTLILSCNPNNEPMNEKLSVISGEYLGQKPPGSTPEIFATGIVSTGLDELNSVFSPNGKEFYFSLRTPWRTITIISIKKENHQWSKPKIPDFVSNYGDVDLSFSSDGEKLFFCSKRPLVENETKEDFDIWVVERMESGWSEPQNLGSEVNSDMEDFYPTLTKNGALYFNSQREGRGTNNIYRSIFNNERFQKAEKLPPPINTEFREFDPFIAKDGSYLFFASERPGGFGGADLYISFRIDEGVWTEPKNLEEKFNSEESEYCPMLTPDGKYFFFTSHRKSKNYVGVDLTYDELVNSLNSPGNGFGDIYWVKADFIDSLIRSNE